MRCQYTIIKKIYFKVLNYRELRENAEFRALFDPSDLPDSINYVEETKRVLLEKTLPEKMYEEPVDPKVDDRFFDFFSRI